MTNPKKKKTEVLVAWNSLKDKIKHLSQDWKIMLTNHQKDLAEKDKIITNLQKPEADRWIFESDRASTTSQKMHALESKLEGVKNLITDNEIAKLKSLVRRGEI